MKTAQVDGKTVTIGDVVCFKSDVEQCGTIVDIKQSYMGCQFDPAEHIRL